MTEKRWPGRISIYESPMKVRAVRFTDAQWSALGALADARGMSRSSLLRLLLERARSEPA